MYERDNPQIYITYIRKKAIREFNNSTQIATRSRVAPPRIG